MQLQAEIILNTTGNYINWRYKFKNAFFEEFLLIFRMNCLFQRGGLGEHCKLPRPGSQSIFRFYIALNYF